MSAPTQHRPPLVSSADWRATDLSDAGAWTIELSDDQRTGPEVRLYRTNERQDFHTDGADIIGLLCLHAARSGGEGQLRTGIPTKEVS